MVFAVAVRRSTRSEGRHLLTRRIRSSRWFCAVAAATTTALTWTPLTHSFAIHPILASRHHCRSVVSCRYLSISERSVEERQMTDDATAILSQAIRAVDPYTAVQKHLQVNENGIQIGSLQYHANDYTDILLVAFGKASSAMSKAAVSRLEEAMPNVPIRGVVIIKDNHASQDELNVLQKHDIVVTEASHPIPDERSVQGAQHVLELANLASSKTLIICCISGGGSSLFCAPRPPLTLADLQETNSALLASGMTIQQMNVIRKRLETGKGGRLAAAAYPATILSLVLSDVIGDPLDLIASGPTVPDSSTWQDAWHLVQNCGLESSLPQGVLQMLQKGVAGELEDTPGKDHPTFLCKSHTIVVGNNEVAVTAAAKEAQRRGYNAIVLGTRIEGEARHVAGVYTAMAMHLANQRKSNSPYTMAKLPAALIGGGETTVTMTSSPGKGGRNQELALAAALQLQSLSLRNVVLASVGTDGTDGPTDAAGAVVDGGTLSRLAGSAEEALQRHDAYTYLEQEESDGHCPLIKTGPTGTNVADVCVTLIR